MAGLTIPGQSGYSVSKLAAHKYMEYVAAGKLDPIPPSKLEVKLGLTDPVARIPNPPPLHSTSRHRPDAHERKSQH